MMRLADTAFLGEELAARARGSDWCCIPPSRFLGWTSYAARLHGRLPLSCRVPKRRRAATAPTKRLQWQESVGIASSICRRRLPGP
jgi:hypothetical protein